MKKLAPIIWTVLAVLLTLILTGSFFYMVVIGCTVAVIATLVRTRTV